MRKVEGRVVGVEDVEVVLVLVVEVDELVGLLGTVGVEINHRIKCKQVGVIVGGELLFEEANGWLSCFRGIAMLEMTAECVASMR